jgi:tubulin polyglutamylase TTLL4
MESTIEKKTVSKKTEEEEDLSDDDQERDMGPKSFILLKSIFGESRPSTVFFDYNSLITSLKKNIEKNPRIINVIDFISETDLDISDRCNKSKMLNKDYNENGRKDNLYQNNLNQNLIIEKEQENLRNIKNSTDVSKNFSWNLPVLRNYVVEFKVYKNVPECILNPCELNGLARTKLFLKANLIWKLLKADKMFILIKKLNKHQRYNHFPCTWQLGRKDNLWRNYKIFNFQFPEDYDYIPETYILPEDKDELKQKFDLKKMWMIKPVASSRGRGIRLMTNRSLEALPLKCLLSRYIEKPHLINNKKYDLRLYVVITGFSPLKIYLYEEGLVRFASEEYCLEDKNKHNRYMHLTNYSVNKCSTHFDKNISTENEFTGSKWSLTALKLFFQNQGINFNTTWEKIQDIVVKSVITVQQQTREVSKKLTKSNNNLFELYGFDILLDSELRPWLIEINLNPSLNCESELDLKIKSSLMTDIFTLIGIVPYSKNSKNTNLLNLENYKNSSDNQQKIEFNETESIESKIKEFSEIPCLDSNLDNESEDLNTSLNSIQSQTQIKKLKINKISHAEEKEIIMYSLDEFSRTGDLKIIFPKKENIEYYSKFISNPGNENFILWNWMKTEQTLAGAQIPRIFLDEHNI